MLEPDEPLWPDCERREPADEPVEVALAPGVPLRLDEDGDPVEWVRTRPEAADHWDARVWQAHW